MEQVIATLQVILSATLADVRRNAAIHGSTFQERFVEYQSKLLPSLERYKHHQDHELDAEILQERFEYETAILHICTQIIAYKAKVLNRRSFRSWPVTEATSPFNWYSLPESIIRQTSEIANDILAADNLGLFLAQLSGELLNQASRKYLGEYHTPLPLVEHLIVQSQITPVDLLQGKKVVDPACGSGIILAALTGKVVAYALENDLPPKYVLGALSRNIFGFDIQPFAVVLTKSLLLEACLPLLGRAPTFPKPTFSNICLLDPLAEYNRFWNSKETFDYVIGNPPFIPVKQANLDYILAFDDIIAGHANLYQLFLWWAIKATSPKGIVSLLLPQSILAGNYFEKLRLKLDQHATLLSLTRMIDRKGIVGDAELQMMVLSLKVEDDGLERDKIAVRVTRNGANLAEISPQAVSYSRVVQHIGDTVIWVVSDNALDYGIVERLQDSCETIAELKDLLKYGNGEYVWNQYKELLLAEEKSDSLPLISAASIQPFTVNFPYTGSHPSHTRPFSRIDDTSSIPVHSGPAILIQRTTRRKVGRRLVAGALAEGFSQRYPRYFLENHVNYIALASSTDSNILFGLCGWLNSDVLNFVFQLRNGTPHLSIFELELLPANVDFTKSLSDIVTTIQRANPDLRSVLVQKLNDGIFDWLRLGPKQRRRIQDVLSWKETVRQH